MNMQLKNLIFIIFLATQLQAQVLVTAPDLSYSDTVGTTIEIPILTEDLNGLNVIAYQFVIEFDENVILPENPYFIKSGTLSGAAGWTVMVNTIVQNQITVGAFGAYPLSGDGELIRLVFNIETLNGSTPILFSSFFYNAGNPDVTTANGSVTNQDCSNSQLILLPSGWSGISSYLIPSIPAMETIFLPVENTLQMVYNFTNSYSPVFGIQPTMEWDSHSGYFIKVTEPVQLIVCGSEIINREIPLIAGWNLVSVVSNNVHFIDEIMLGLDVEIVKEAVGYEIYWPAMEIQTLYFFEPGKAYLIKMNSEGTLVFPD
ncbi:MAG TPA: cohesin domain-containing protein [Bacteroidales bacterium]|nr:cohesin domain-containing protein [Bacteroidales bacterium]